MALKTIPASPATARASQEAVRDAVKELQSLSIKVVAGAAADANIAVAGLDTNDVIVFVGRLNIEADTGTDAEGNKVQDVSDLTAEASVPTTGNLQLADTNTTGDKLLVVFYALTGGA